MFNNGDVIMYCFAIIIIGLILSFFTWVVFVLIIALIKKICRQDNIAKWLICAVGIILTLSTFALVFGTNDLFYNPLVYGNCICISWGVWFYKFSPSPENE